MIFFLDRPSPCLVLPWLELLIKIASPAFSQSIWLLCSPFGILQFILKNTNKKKMMTLTSISGTCNSTSRWCSTPWWSASYLWQFSLFRFFMVDMLTVKVLVGATVMMRVMVEEAVMTRACCREVKIPNQYGGVILWCLFMYRIDL